MAFLLVCLAAAASAAPAPEGEEDQAGLPYEVEDADDVSDLFDVDQDEEEDVDGHLVVKRSAEPHRSYRYGGRRSYGYNKPRYYKPRYNSYGYKKR